MRKLLRTAAIVMASCAMVLIGAAPGNAESAGTSSNPYDYQDPAATGCNQQAYQIGSDPVIDAATGQTVATIQVYYSTSCQTNWIRVTGNPYGGTAEKFMRTGLDSWHTERDGGYGSSYSMMLYAPGDTAITGWVDLYAPGASSPSASGTFSY